jgi:hypothetical protein
VANEWLSLPRKLQTLAWAAFGLGILAAVVRLLILFRKGD